MHPVEAYSRLLELLDWYPKKPMHANQDGQLVWIVPLTSNRSAVFVKHALTLAEECVASCGNDMDLEVREQADAFIVECASAIEQQAARRRMGDRHQS